MTKACLNVENIPNAQSTDDFYYQQSKGNEKYFICETKLFIYSHKYHRDVFKARYEKDKCSPKMFKNIENMLRFFPSIGVKPLRF